VISFEFAEGCLRILGEDTGAEGLLAAMEVDSDRDVVVLGTHAVVVEGF